MSSKSTSDAVDTAGTPDQSAAEYLRDFLNKARRLARRAEPAGWSVSLTEWYEWTRERQHQYHGGARAEGTLRAIDEDDWAFEAQYEPSTRLHEIESIHEEATAALKERRLDDFAELLHQLIGFIGHKAPKFTQSSNYENWLSLYERSLHASAARPDEQPEDALDVGAAVTAAVTALSIELVRLIAREQTALHAIEWRLLEHVLATALQGLGFDVELTQSSKDGGKDIVASCWLKGERKTYFVEIKHWRSGKRVLSQTIYDFLEVNLLHRTHGGVFISTSGFASCAFSCLTEFHASNIHLGDSDKVAFLCRQFVRKAAGLWTPGACPSELLIETAAIGSGVTSGLLTNPSRS